MQDWAGSTVSDFERDVYCLLGVPLDAQTMPSTVACVRAAIAARRRLFLSTPNLNFLIGCQSSAAFRQSLIDSDLSIADGMPLVWMARLLGLPITERVAGSGVFERLRDEPLPAGGAPLKLYLFGGPDGAAEAAARRLNAQAGGWVCVGYHAPGFGSVEAMSDEDTIERINASGADFLLVALGAAKGQAWIQHNLARLTVPVVSHLGAVVNFAAGTVRRAPTWMQRSGLEWLWRIREEPALWRRYCRDGTSLLSLFATRLLPYAVWLRLNRPPAHAACTVALARQPGGYRIVLGGAVCDPVADELRAALAEACNAGEAVDIDVSRVTWLGPGLCGLLLVLKKHLDARGALLRVRGADARLRRLFRWNGVEDLLVATPEAVLQSPPMPSGGRSKVEISAVEPDWSRERVERFWDPGRQLLRALRRYQRLGARRDPLARVARKWCVLQHRFWSVVTGADIPLNCRIGGGLLIPHPNGIVISPEVEIGPNCLIFQQVTLGTREGQRPPVIGGHVDIGAGAKVLGALTVGDHARIGANAVVLADVAPGDTVAGIPARSVRSAGSAVTPGAVGTEQVPASAPVAEAPVESA